VRPCRTGIESDRNLMAADGVGSTKWVSAQEDVRKSILFFPCSASPDINCHMMHAMSCP
jgi:hypothetical protein